MVRWMMPFIAACCLLATVEIAIADSCFRCHGASGKTVHAVFACTFCHLKDGRLLTAPDRLPQRAAGCISCHPGRERIFDQAMSTRLAEQRFVQRSYAKVDSGFFSKNCSLCHVSSCSDCHDSFREPAKPTVGACQNCHRGYYTGWDYAGRAPREDNMRYQRGQKDKGETWLKMLPDAHYRAGMTCGDCHGMSSLMAGGKSSKKCLDCHSPDLKVIEHSVAAHMEKLECYACHSGWAPQEYGTFFLRFRDPELKEDFDLKPGPSLEYLRSAYLKLQDAPPLGINRAGRISPIRPQFIAYYTDIQSARNNGPENILLAAEWRAFFPHTIQRGVVTCEGCHDNPRRFLLEPASQRIYRTAKDGLGLESFWLQKGQQVVNGDFLPLSRYQQLSSKSPAYTKVYIQKWRSFLNHVEPSSQR